MLPPTFDVSGEAKNGRGRAGVLMPPALHPLPGVQETDLPIGVTSMTDGDDIHNMFRIVDRIQNAVVPYADPPEVVCSLKLSTSVGTRSERKRLYSSEDVR